MNIKMFLLKKKTLTVLACLLAAGGMLWAVNSPLVIGASATTRQLPIYCVQRDQKTISISFDAAWGDVILRQRSTKEKSEAGEEVSPASVCIFI
ncbi:MAG: hypothetical protein J6J87_04895 [Oscillospiraceae bacterium]|nr:hypothetical protein [Oscillospiraceae bacterium]